MYCLTGTTPQMNKLFDSKRIFIFIVYALFYICKQCCYYRFTGWNHCFGEYIENGFKDGGGNHRLLKQMRNGKPIRRRCKSCYSSMSAAYGRVHALFHAKQVTSVCSGCPGNPFICQDCFTKTHA